jgi:hypothetical protein
MRYQMNVFVSACFLADRSPSRNEEIDPKQAFSKAVRGAPSDTREGDTGVFMPGRSALEGVLPANCKMPSSNCRCASFVPGPVFAASSPAIERYLSTF